MSEERDPVRLREDPAADASLREALGAVAGERADDAMLERVLAGVLASSAGSGGTSGGGGGASAATKIAIGLGGTTMTAVLVVLAVHGASIPAAPSAVPSTLARDAAAVADAAPALVDAWIASDAGTDASAPAHAAVHHPPPPSAPPSSAATPPESDEQLLFRAIRARDPEAGLALLRQHRALYPESASAEDREAQIAIDLARLGRADEARAAAAAFRARWPSSPALPHVEAELERMPRE